MGTTRGSNARFDTRSTASASQLGQLDDQREEKRGNRGAEEQNRTREKKDRTSKEQARQKRENVARRRQTEEETVELGRLPCNL